ncbi:hypothetical protein LWI28_006818 [Acer negundo]|uniref:Uncharacterized protein n=1 Tax=Acer negundo TaxID=4023 RepID=A0AAD5JD16_ACENE|nr:hypothetical protein LWI28_006818 [Acer negundo]
MNLTGLMSKIVLSSGFWMENRDPTPIKRCEPWSLSASLNLLALALVIGPAGTCNGSLSAAPLFSSPQVCVNVIERTAGYVIGNDIPPLDNTEQLGSFSGSNQVFTQRSATKGGENMCGVPPVAVNHEDLVEPQFGDVFGCRNEQYNEQNNYPNHEVDNEANNEQVNDRVNDLQNMDEDPA